MRVTQKPSYRYIESLYLPENEHKLKSRELAEEINRDGISISQTEAHLIKWLLQGFKPKKILEIGTLTGLSCQYFIESLQTDGTVYTLEKSKDHADRARQALAPYIENQKCILLEGDAREVLQNQLQHEIFDAIFIDGNKAAYLDYWNWSKEHLNFGGLILIDNVFLSGAVWDTNTDESQPKFSAKQIDIMKAMTNSVLNDPRFQSTFIPTEEGLLLARKVIES